MFRDLREFLQHLEAAGELVRIGEELSPQFEVGAAIKYAGEKGGPAVLCERVKGYNIPIVGNLLGTTRRLAMAFGVPEEELTEAYRRGRQNPIKAQQVATGPVQEVVIDRDVDILATIPVLTHHERDISPYMTSAFTVAKDPETGMQSMGLHRIQVKGKDTIGIFLGTPPLSHFLAKAEAQGRPLEVAIVSGADPVTFFASVVLAPQGIDKFDLAGGFARRPLEVVQCRTVDLRVPAHAEFVLEGSITPRHREPEGPFGESTGYYFTFHNPVAKIKAITHRRNPIYHALMPFGPEELVLMSSWDVEFQAMLQAAFPFVRGLRTINWLATAIQIEKKAEDEPFKLIDALLAQPFTKVVVVVDEDVNIADPREVMWAIATRAHLDKDVIIRADLPGPSIDPSTSGGETTPDLAELVTRAAKMGIDATKPLAERERFEKIDVPAPVKARVHELMKRVLGGRS